MEGVVSRLGRLSRSVEGRVAVVTGAGSGMGQATAMVFADEGAKVVVVDLDSSGVAETVAAIDAVHGAGRARGVSLDTTDRQAVSDMVGRTVHEWGSIDCLVNNAGVSMLSSILQDDGFDGAWQRTIDVNLTAYVVMAREIVPHMKTNGWGRVVNIASTESIVATAGLAAYSASKAGVTGLTRSMAVELGRHGITVNCICPGPILTGMTAGIPDAAKESYAKRKVPLRRYGDPEEVAHMTLSLCLPAASFTNGATLVVDGGMTVRHT